MRTQHQDIFFQNNEEIIILTAFFRSTILVLAEILSFQKCDFSRTRNFIYHRLCDVREKLTTSKQKGI